MKIRNGFVSNSSSSSFIMIGVDSKLTEKQTPLSSESGLRTLYIDEYGDVEEVTGYILVDSDEYLDIGSLSIQKINQMSDELARKLNVDFSVIKLYYGTRPS